MAHPRFVHLRLYSEYSIVDGMARVDDAVAAAAADGMPALAITDQSNLFGAIKFFQAARGAGVQPIVGCDLWITNDRNRDAPYRATLLCRNRDGYLALCELLTRGHAENHLRGPAAAQEDSRGCRAARRFRFARGQQRPAGFPAPQGRVGGGVPGAQADRGAGRAPPAS